MSSRNPAKKRDVGRRRRIKVSHGTRIFLQALLGGFPAVAIALYLIRQGDFSSNVSWNLAALILVFWLGFALSLQSRVIRPLQTISNLLMALRQGDFSIRIRRASQGEELGELAAEVNLLARILQEQRLAALEATHLLQKVMEEIEIAVFTFDGDGKLRLVNRAGEKLLAQPRERLSGRDAGRLGLTECLEGPDSRVLEASFPGGSGRWELRRRTFREAGLPHTLLVLSDLSRALRDEERHTWKRLIRVIGHELNNSLAPIKSIASSLERLLKREPRPPNWREDLHKGLAVIAGRAESLSRFMEGYSRLAHLPPPRPTPVKVEDWVRRVAGLETRKSILVEPGPALQIMADGDQLDQLLINILRNGVEASAITGGGVVVGWAQAGQFLELWVKDDGPGIGETGNLFVPFFTTKPDGSGIGLVLCRQIAEAHGGTLTLHNRKDSSGCIARLRLPLSPAKPARQ